MTKECRYLEILAVRVAAGSSIRDSAANIGCSESTAYQISSSTEFKQRVSELRTQATDQAVGKLSELACQAVQVLAVVMSDADARAGDRIRAAVAVLTMLSPISELHELRQRIDTLEQLQSGRTAA